MDPGADDAREEAGGLPPEEEPDIFELEGKHTPTHLPTPFRICCCCRRRCCCRCCCCCCCRRSLCLLAAGQVLTAKGTAELMLTLQVAGAVQG